MFLQVKSLMCVAVDLVKFCRDEFLIHLIPVINHGQNFSSILLQQTIHSQWGVQSCPNRRYLFAIFKDKVFVSFGVYHNSRIIIPSCDTHFGILYRERAATKTERPQPVYFFCLFLWMWLWAFTDQTYSWLSSPSGVPIVLDSRASDDMVTTHLHKPFVSYFPSFKPKSGWCPDPHRLDLLSWSMNFSGNASLVSLMTDSGAIPENYNGYNYYF